MIEEQGGVRCESLEEALDATLAALVQMDSLALAGLAKTCQSMDAVAGGVPPGTDIARIRLSSKLKLLERMLMQTEAGLHVLGISTRAYGARPCTPMQTSLREL